MSEVEVLWNLWDIILETDRDTKADMCEQRDEWERDDGI